MQRHHAALLLILGVLASACSDGASSPVVMLPTAPSPQAVSAPNGIAVSGKVYDTANRPLGGATVEVVNGPSAGVKATTLADGQYALFGEFTADTQFRATKDGHEPQLKNLSPFCQQCRPNHWVFFALALPEPPANIAGDYTLTITSAASCTMLPGHARQRIYSASIVALPDQPSLATTSLRAIATGADIVPNVSWEGLWFNVAGNYMEMVMGDLHGQPGLVERTGPNAYFSIGGIGTTTVASSSASTIAMSFDAEIRHCELKPGVAPLDANGRFECPADRAVASAVCLSRDHQLVLTRR